MKMKKILIVTSQNQKFTEFADTLTREGGFDIVNVNSPEGAVAHVGGAVPRLVVIDEIVGGTPGLTIARSILMKNAMINQAVVSPLTPEEFHEASEGLGIMAQISPVPDAASAKLVMDILAKMP
jgi:DNA-binding NtrC family response regulator